MTRQAIQWRVHLGHIHRVHTIRDWVLIYRVTDSVLDRQMCNLREVVLGQPNFAVENRYEVLGGKHLWPRIRTMTLETERVRRRCAEQLRVISAVRLVAGCAALFECGLVQVILFVLLGLVGVAAEARVDWVGL